jgi:23S rRNA pseudouridine1911/1915/1917 synthase
VTLEVLYEDNHLLAVAKPAGLLVQGDETGDVSLLDLARDYRKYREKKPGNVYVGLIHRIDRPVSGLVLLAKTSKGASRLSEQFRQHQVRKLYLAICPKPVRADRSMIVGSTLLWEDRLTRPGTSKPSTRRLSAGEAKVQWARTKCEIRAEHRGHLLVALEPQTGRKHQLRAQLAMRGCPIVGDRRYGSTETFSAGLALHSLALAFLHPIRREPVVAVAVPPPSWKTFGFDSKLYRPGADFAVAPEAPATGSDDEEDSDS